MMFSFVADFLDRAVKFSLDTIIIFVQNKYLELVFELVKNWYDEQIRHERILKMSENTKKIEIIDKEYI